MEIPVRMPETRTDASNWESPLGPFSFGQSTSLKLCTINDANSSMFIATYSDSQGLLSACLCLRPLWGTRKAETALLDSRWGAGIE